MTFSFPPAKHIPPCEKDLWGASMYSDSSTESKSKWKCIVLIKTHMFSNCSRAKIVNNDAHNANDHDVTKSTVMIILLHCSLPLEYHSNDSLPSVRLSTLRGQLRLLLYFDLTFHASSATSSRADSAGLQFLMGNGSGFKINQKAPVCAGFPVAREGTTEQSTYSPSK